MTKYQANTKLRAIKLYQKGVDLNQISKELNITNANEIDHWLKRYQQQGLSGLKAKQTKTKYGGKFKLKVLNWRKQHNTSYQTAALHFKVNNIGTIANWQKKFDISGVKALFVKQGRPAMKQVKAREGNKQPRSPSELSELEALRLENRALRVENEYLKKLKALVQKRGHLPKKGKSSKN